MPEPTETSLFGIPLQQAGGASRTGLNAALNAVDHYMGALYAVVAGLDTETTRIKIHAPILATAGQTLIEMPEPFDNGSTRTLLVFRSGIFHAEGIHWNETDSTHLTFVAGCEEDEVIVVIELQKGRDVGILPSLPTIGAQGAIEVLEGVIDSTNGIDGNGTFTVSHVIADDTIPRITISGLVGELTPITHYTWTSNTITFVAGAKPRAGEVPMARYVWTY